MQHENTIPRRKINGTFETVVIHPDSILAAEGLSLSFVERFLGKVRKTESCWIWTGAHGDNGQGRIGRAGKGSGNIAANRASWILHNGEIPDGMEIFSVCPIRNRICINPNHLAIGWHSDIKRYRDAGRTDDPISCTQFERIKKLCELSGIVESQLLAEWKITHIVPKWMLDLGFSETFADRLWARVKKTESCWLWTGSKNDDGYGMIGTGIGTGCMGTHRASWMIHQGPIKDGLSVLHNCPGGDNPACCNPDHLWLGTPRQNSEDATNKNRQFDSKHWNARLTYDQIREIKTLFALGGITKAELGRKFGVAPGHIFRILNNQRGYNYFKITVSGVLPKSTHTGNTITKQRSRF